MNKDGSLKVKKRPKRYFSSEVKKNLYVQWKASNLGKTECCKLHDLVPSAFGKWCRQLEPSKQIEIPENNWVPVTQKEKSLETLSNPPVINIPPITRILLLGLCIISMVRGLFDAIAVIW